METFNQSIQVLISVIEYILIIYFFLSVLYVFIFSLGGHTYKKRKRLKNISHRAVAVFIPAYKEDAVIVDVAKNALKQDYPKEYFDVVVIADSMKEETLTRLRALPIIVVEVSFENSTKTKALNKAMATLERKYDVALILDADNIMEYEFISKINESFSNGYQIVQGHRKAKNLNTSFAILDAASEEINNHIYRRGHRALGFSSGLIGSGMAFDYNLFKSTMANIKAIGGFDKELEFEMAKQEIIIEYLQEAYVLDEKIQKSSDFSKQRKRWLSTQVVYLKKYFWMGWVQLFKHGNLNFFDKLLQMIVPPRVLLLGLTIIFTLFYVLNEFWLQLNTTVPMLFWAITAILLFLAFVLALPKSFYNKNTFKALVSLPGAFFRMFMLLFNLKGANKKFIHTAKDYSQSK
jgi:cellulose synthase/poly-beta-1,6-N-acetylglucosamine synthase-like glycosyltransferase